MLGNQTISSTPNPPAQTAVSKNANFQVLGLILISVFLNAVGQLVFKAAMNSLGPLEISLDHMLKMATNPLLLLGLVIYAGSTFLWLISLSKADLSFAYPFLSLTYFVVLLGGAVLFAEQITLTRVVGFVVVVVGLLIVARSEQKRASSPFAGAYVNTPLLIVFPQIYALISQTQPGENSSCLKFWFMSLSARNRQPEQHWPF
jgi:multidrug transporter EmrE-like cation transporter